MEIHLEILRNQCRLCGKGLTKESRDKNDLTNKVKQICGIDFENDDLCIHVTLVSDTCRRKLQSGVRIRNYVPMCFVKNNTSSRQGIFKSENT